MPHRSSLAYEFACKGGFHDAIYSARIRDHFDLKGIFLRFEIVFSENCEKPVSWKFSLVKVGLEFLATEANRFW